MKIAFIGQKSIKSLETDLATQFVQVGHKTNLYLNSKKDLQQVNGMRVFYTRLLFCVLHAVVFFRADIVILRGEAKKYRRLIALFAPDVYVHTDTLQQGVHVKRLAVSDVILHGHGVQAGQYAVIDASVGISSAVKAAIKQTFGSSFAFIQLDREAEHREVVRSLMAGAAFVVTNASILEAMSYGKVVVTERTDLSEDVADIVLPYTNEEEAIAIMSQLIADPMLRASLGHMSRGYAEHFAWRAVADTYLEEWTQAMEERSGRFGIIQSYVKR